MNVGSHQKFEDDKPGGMKAIERDTPGNIMTLLETKPWRSCTAEHEIVLKSNEEQVQTSSYSYERNSSA